MKTPKTDRKRGRVQIRDRSKAIFIVLEPEIHAALVVASLDSTKRAVVEAALRAHLNIKESQ